MSGFLTEALEGDYPPFGENRLTQITAASFNQSRIFRTAFLKFIGARQPNKVAQAKAATQSHVLRAAERGLLDLEITRGSRVVAVVENKVEAPLHARQLTHYDGVVRLKGVHKVALVREYFSPRRGNGEWTVLHWRDLYLALRAVADEMKVIPPVDELVIRNYLEYLESAHMHTPNRISKTDMKQLAVMLHGLRFAHKTNFKGLSADPSVFDSAANWTRMMEAIFEQSRLIPKLKRAAKKNYRFKPSMSHWHDGENKGKDATYPWIGLEWQISFKRPHGRTKAVGVGLFVDESAKWNIDAFRHVTDANVIDSRMIFDGRSDVVLADLTRRLLKQWQRWLR